VVNIVFNFEQLIGKAYLSFLKPFINTVDLLLYFLMILNILYTLFCSVSVAEH